MDLFIKRGVSDLKAHFEHKKVRVTGTITLFKNQPQIVLADPAQIELIGG
jgi:DNA/RNA endonuclease YhcR with UshA esterase domain